jgi:hypothetical protein
MTSRPILNLQDLFYGELYLYLCLCGSSFSRPIFLLSFIWICVLHHLGYTQSASSDFTYLFIFSPFPRLHLSFSLCGICFVTRHSFFPPHIFADLNGGAGWGELVTARLLELLVQSRRGHGCPSVFSVVCCHVVSASGWSLVQRSPTECDREASVMLRPSSTWDCCVMTKQRVYSFNFTYFPVRKNGGHELYVQFYLAKM